MLEVLWRETRDLIQPANQRSLRQLALRLQCGLLASLNEPLSPPNRTMIFEALRAHDAGDDVPQARAAAAPRHARR